jgi:hypothetical protein
MSAVKKVDRAGFEPAFNLSNFSGFGWLLILIPVLLLLLASYKLLDSKRKKQRTIPSSYCLYAFYRKIFHLGRSRK